VCVCKRLSMLLYICICMSQRCWRLTVVTCSIYINFIFIVLFDDPRNLVELYVTFSFVFSCSSKLVLSISIGVAICDGYNLSRFYSWPKTPTNAIKTLTSNLLLFLIIIGYTGVGKRDAFTPWYYEYNNFTLILNVVPI
jgi:hypothetical protein